MITCYNCGKQVSDDAICPECGGALVPAGMKHSPADPLRRTSRWPISRSGRGAAQQAQPGRFDFTGGFKGLVWLCMGFFLSSIPLALP